MSAHTLLEEVPLEALGLPAQFSVGAGSSAYYQVVSKNGEMIGMELKNPETDSREAHQRSVEPRAVHNPRNNLRSQGVAPRLAMDPVLSRMPAVHRIMRSYDHYLSSSPSPMNDGFYATRFKQTRYARQKMRLEHVSSVPRVVRVALNNLPVPTGVLALANAFDNPGAIDRILHTQSMPGTTSDLAIQRQESLDMSEAPRPSPKKKTHDNDLLSTPMPQAA